MGRSENNERVCVRVKEFRVRGRWLLVTGECWC